MAMTPADQAAMSANTPQAQALREQKSAQMQHANQRLMATSRPMLEAMNDPRIMRLALLADEKHCAIAQEEPPAQAPIADPCGPEWLPPQWSPVVSCHRRLLLALPAAGRIRSRRRRQPLHRHPRRARAIRS
jgi:hypothetical protein